MVRTVLFSFRVHHQRVEQCLVFVVGAKPFKSASGAFSFSHFAGTFLVPLTRVCAPNSQSAGEGYQSTNGVQSRFSNPLTAASQLLEKKNTRFIDRGGGPKPDGVKELRSESVAA